MSISSLTSKVLVILTFLLILASCATIQAQRPSDVVSCAEPEGYEYVCRSDSECMDYMKGYGGVVRNRFRAQEHSGWYPDVTVHVVPIHLFVDHRSIYFIGRIEAEKIDGKIYQKVWMMLCDLEENVLEESYTEGFQGEDLKSVTVW